MNGWLIDRGKWIFAREVLLHLNLTGLRYSYTIHYCTQPVLAIALELNVLLLVYS